MIEQLEALDCVLEVRVMTLGRARKVYVVVDAITDATRKAVHRVLGDSVEFDILGLEGVSLLPKGAVKL